MEQIGPSALGGEKTKRSEGNGDGAAERAKEGGIVWSSLVGRRVRVATTPVLGPAHPGTDNELPNQSVVLVLRCSA